MQDYIYSSIALLAMVIHLIINFNKLFTGILLKPLTYAKLLETFANARRCENRSVASDSRVHSTWAGLM